jgi:hypothetical protein
VSAKHFLAEELKLEEGINCGVEFTVPLSTLLTTIVVVVSLVVVSAEHDEVPLVEAVLDRSLVVVAYQEIPKRQMSEESR